MASTRLPGKVLLETGGKPLIQWTYEAVCRCKSIDRVEVLTDSGEVFRACQSRGITVVRTGEHPNGTSRIAERAARLPRGSLVLNVQADEPETKAEHLSTLIESMREWPGCDMATLAAPAILQELQQRSVVKVAVDSGGFARDFFRDYDRSSVYRHLGIYAYTPEFLAWYVALPEGEREKDLRLEQLRALDAGCRIRVKIVEGAGVGIDTSEEWEAFKKVAR